MLLRGCSVVIMSYWYSFATTFVFLYLDDASPGGLKLELQILYTVAFNYVATIISTRMEQGEAELNKTNVLCGAKLSEAMTKTLVGLSDIVQTLLSYLVGCGWADIVPMVFTSLGKLPTGTILIQNILITVFLTLAVAFAIATTGQEAKNADAASREATEAFLLINAAAFFIGSAWLTVIRNTAAVWMALLEFTVGNFLSLFVADSAAAHFTAAVAVAAFSSALTVGTFKLSAYASTTVQKVENSKANELV